MSTDSISKIFAINGKKYQVVPQLDNSPQFSVHFQKGILIKPWIRGNFNTTILTDNWNEFTFMYQNKEISLFTSYEEFLLPINTFFHSFNRIGELLSSCLSKFNLELTPKGLQYNTTLEGLQYSFFISCNPEKICDFLKLDYNTWKNSFKNSFELTDWLSKSPFVLSNLPNEGKIFKLVKDHSHKFNNKEHTCSINDVIQFFDIQDRYIEFITEIDHLNKEWIKKRALLP